MAGTVFTLQPMPWCIVPMAGLGRRLALEPGARVTRHTVPRGRAGLLEPHDGCSPLRSPTSECCHGRAAPSV